MTSRKPSKSELERLYSIEKKSAREIGLEYGRSHAIVLKWLRSDGIPIRSGRPPSLPIPPKEDLIRLFVTDRLSVKKIVQIYGCSVSTCRTWLKHYEIPQRQYNICSWYKIGHPLPKNFPTIEKRPAKASHTTACNILKDHAHDLKDDPERLSTEFLQKMIGVKCD